MSFVGVKKRLNDFIRPDGGRSILVHIDPNITWQAVDLNEKTVMRALVVCGVDGIITGLQQGLGQIEFFLGKRAPALLIDVESNSIGVRGSPRSLKFGQGSANDRVHYAFKTGASAIVATFEVGHDMDQDEASNFASICRLIAKCEELGLPSLIRAVPIGERITKDNYADCVGLAARMASEAGASCVAVPYCGSKDAVRNVVEVTGVPTFLLELREKKSRFQPDCDSNELVSTVLDAGASGLILSTPYRKSEVENIEQAALLVHGGRS